MQVAPTANVVPQVLTCPNCGLSVTPLMVSGPSPPSFVRVTTIEGEVVPIDWPPKLYVPRL